MTKFYFDVNSLSNFLIKNTISSSNLGKNAWLQKQLPKKAPQRHLQ